MNLNELETKYGIPAGLLTAVRRVESGGKNSLSPAGALGEFQFMPSTAKAYGINPLDPEQSAEGAARMFADLGKQYKGNWNAAIAHYNGGTKAGNAVASGGEAPSPETRNYIPKVVGAMNTKPKEMSAEDAAKLLGLGGGSNDVDAAARLLGLGYGEPKKIGREGFADALKSVVSEQNPLTAAIAQGGNTAMQYIRGMRQLVGMGDTKEGKNHDALKDEINTQFPVAGPVGDIGAQIGLTYLGAKALPTGLLTSKVPMLANPYASNAATGAALGGLKYGDLEQRATDAGLGAAGGAVGTLAGRALPALWGGMKGIVEPFTQKGQENIVGRTLRNFSVNPSRVEKAAQYSSKVPGVNPTLAEAALDPGISNLQRQFAVGTADQQLANNAARIAAMRSAGGTESDVAKAIAARGVATDPLYAAADQAVVTSDDALRNVLSRLPQGAMEKARNIARMEGKPIQIGRDIPAQTVYKNSAGELVDSSMMVPPAAPKGRSLLDEIKNAGGINTSTYRELNVTPVEAVRGNPGLFNKNGLSEDGLVEFMQQKGWLTDEMIQNANKYDTGGSLELAKDYLRSALARESVYHPSQAMDIYAHDQAMKQFGEFASGISKTDIPAKNAQYTGRGIDLIKKGIDDVLDGNPTSSIGKHEKRAVQSVKEDLLKWADANITPYGQARQKFAELSKPINSMQIGNEILRKSSSAAEDALGNPTLRNEALSRVLRDGDQLAKTVTKFNKATLKDSLDPVAYQTLADVRKDLARKAASENLGRATGSPTAQNLAAQNVMRQIAGPLGAPSGFAEANIWPTLLRPVNWAMKAQDPKIEQTLIRSLSDPKLAAELVKRKQAQKSIGSLLGPIENYAIPGISGGLLSERQ